MGKLGIAGYNIKPLNTLNNTTYRDLMVSDISLSDDPHVFWNFQKTTVINQALSKLNIFLVFDSNEKPLVPRSRAHVILQL